MGYQELIDSLIKEGDEKIKKIWLDAERVAEKILDEKNKKINEIINRYEKLKKISVKEQTDHILLDAEKESRRIRLEAEERFLKKLFDLAVSMLHLLRNKNYRDIFKALLMEIPEYKWDIIIVNDDDLDIAKKFFSNTQVIADRRISGGFIIMTRDKNICIDNTFEKRLQRAWQEIIPGLMKEIRSVTENRK